LFLGTYARKETVAGYLSPASGTAKVFAPQLGTIKEIYVAEGDHVDQGQPLLIVETSQIAGDDVDINGEMLGILVAQEERLNKQIAAEKQRANSEEERLTAKMTNLQSQAVELQAQLNIQKERIRISQDLVTSAVELRSKGLESGTESKRRQLLLLEQQQQQASLNEQLAVRRSELDEARYNLQQLPTVMAEKVRSLQTDLATTEQRTAEINGRRAYVLRAPTAGLISTVQATIGQFADPKRLQMEIVPANGTLQAQLFVPTRAIGFVQPGQEVRVLYDAFPYQRFGAFSGRIVTVSQTILTATDATGPLSLKEPSYRVTAELNHADIGVRGKRVPLQADMMLKADIILERRSLMAWLLDPLLSVRM
jgi:membrane fusion protein